MKLCGVSILCDTALCTGRDYVCCTVVLVVNCVPFSYKASCFPCFPFLFFLGVFPWSLWSLTFSSHCAFPSALSHAALRRALSESSSLLSTEESLNITKHE
uniref:Uncharacterized protein n=1 Tax=Ixodes ricinus TaxID=34613 RepID=A0A6B0UGA1_IXORI